LGHLLAHDDCSHARVCWLQTCPLEAQSEQAAPLLPHAAWEIPCWHSRSPLAPRVQQPSAHVLELHTGALRAHARLRESQKSKPRDGQSLHATPPVPHAVASVPARHRPFASQQPVGQVRAEHAPASGWTTSGCVTSGKTPPSAKNSSSSPERPQLASNKKDATTTSKTQEANLRPSITTSRRPKGGLSPSAPETDRQTTALSPRSHVLSHLLPRRPPRIFLQAACPLVREFVVAR
jgi:hypothetical protein